MPIAHSDRISGTIYVISTNAENARDRAIEYLASTTGDPIESYGVYDHKDEAEKELYDKFSSYDTDRDRVYAISLDIRAADEEA